MRQVSQEDEIARLFGVGPPFKASDCFFSSLVSPLVGVSLVS